MTIGTKTLFMFIAILAEFSVAADVSVSNLRCEYQINPIGIDVLRPRLSWNIESSKRGQVQTAYRILVASAPELLKEGKADLWDSGRVTSDKSNQIVYSGKSLVSRQECFWKVRVWDGKNKKSQYSIPAKWEMGLLKKGDWQKARWIGNEVQSNVLRETPDVNDCIWIWNNEQGVDSGNLPAGERFFRNKFTVPNDIKIKTAQVFATVDDEVQIFINGQQIMGRQDNVHSLKKADIADKIHTGENVVAIVGRNFSPGPAAMLCKVKIKDANDKTYVIVSDKNWRSAKDCAGNWTEIDFNDSDWQQAYEIRRYGQDDKLEIFIADPGHPAPFVRKEFTVDGQVRRARVYACGLAYAQLHLNGQKVGGNRERDPAFTDFSKRQLYVVHDITNLIKPGKNAVGAILGTGFYDMHDITSWEYQRAPWRGEPRLRLMLAIDYADGRSQTITSGEDWKIATGPIIRDSIYGGEIYDARKEMPGWDDIDFNDANWKPAFVLPSPGGKLKSLKCPPVEIARTITPISVKEPKPGIFLVDMGENFSGHTQLILHNAPAGTAITMRYAERIDEAGMISLQGIGHDMFRMTPPQIFQQDTYICKGGQTEIWEQRFSYSGFRYVEVSGFPGTPTVDNFRGRFAYTNFEKAGEFSCSNELLNKIQSAVIQSYHCNTQSIPTDCPQREKNGWTGDAHLVSETGMMNFNAATFYTKWLDDFSDNQLPDGRRSVIIPTGGWGHTYGGFLGEHIVWETAYNIIGWYLYLYYGDERILERHYDNNRKYVDFISTLTKDGTIPFNSLGDWLAWSSQTSEQLTGTIYFYNAADILAKSAKILGKTQDAKKYAELAEKTKQAINAKWLNAEKNSYDTGSQCALAESLFHGIVPNENYNAVFNTLAADAEAKGHIDAGLLGTKSVMRVLSQGGRSDLAYRLVNRTEKPGWGWFISQGATTLYEDWNGSNSLNHAAFGDVSNWFYQWIAGIGLDVNAPGFKHIIIRPNPVGDLKWAKAWHDCPYGKIEVSWEKRSAGFYLDVNIPANTTATVYIPVKNAESVLESERPVKKAIGVTAVKDIPNAVAIEIGSGKYNFKSDF
jgi:alpha-L-rhamnosidase